MDNLNDYDIHLVLSCVANQITDISRFDKSKDLHLLNDYKCLYYKLRKYFMNKEEK